MLSGSFVGDRSEVIYISLLEKRCLDDDADKQSNASVKGCFFFALSL